MPAKGTKKPALGSTAHFSEQEEKVLKEWLPIIAKLPT